MSPLQAFDITNLVRVGATRPDSGLSGPVEPEAKMQHWRVASACTAGTPKTLL